MATSALLKTFINIAQRECLNVGLLPSETNDFTSVKSLNRAFC